MNRISGFYFYLLFLTLVACQSDPKKVEVEEDGMNFPCLFNLSRTFTPEESNLSFPLWFNDSLIRKHRIETLTRTLYATVDSEDTTDLLVREIKKYTFDKEGRVVSLYVEHYYDHTLVGSMTFTMDKHDERGYALVHPRKGAYSTGDEEILNQFRIYVKEMYSRKFLVYENLRSGDYLFFMTNEKNWGPLSVDSILNPQSHDMIVLGTPEKPHKRYRVENRVNEHDVILYTYRKDFLQRISFDKYPFHYERSLTFNDKGYCTGFIDSTFSNERYLTRRQADFRSDGGLIHEIILRNDSGKSKDGFQQLERLEYTFFEEK